MSDGHTDNELSDSDSTHSTWDDGLNADEIASVLNFLRHLETENDFGEFIQDDGDENDDSTDEGSTTSMTTTAATYISGEEDDENAIETQDEDEDYDDISIDFHFPSQ